MPAGNVWPVPDAVPDRLAAVFDPLGNAMHTVMEVPVSGKTVLITGCGPIGLFAVAAASAAGAARVLVSEPNGFKRILAEKAGHVTAFDPGLTDTVEAVREITDGLGPEIVLEMSGNPRAVADAFRAVQNGGDVVLLGIPHGDVEIDWAEDIIFKGITVHAINGRRMYDTWYQCQSFLLNRSMHIDHIITHEFPAEEFEQGFSVIAEGTAAKVLLKF
jgi:threonine 3-dehydrogenase